MWPLKATFLKNVPMCIYFFFVGGGGLKHLFSVLEARNLESMFTSL